MRELTGKNFESTVNTNGLVVVDFWAPWCGPCKAVMPVLESLQQELGASVVFCKVDPDEHSALAAEHEVSSLPFIQFWKDGRLVNTVSGAYPKHKIKAFIEEAALA